MLEVEEARKLLEQRALDREIVKVYAPDAWFLKRGTTAPALRHTLVGNAFTAARRTGKQIVLETKDPDTTLGVHLGMSGRVLVDDEEAGDPLIYASNKRMPKWHRFGVEFADGGSFMMRDPRRLGAVVLDPDESRLGPDASALTRKQFEHALGMRTAPVKAVLMDQARIAGLGNLLVDEVLWRGGYRADATSRFARRRRTRRALQSDSRHGSHARQAGRITHGRHAARPRDALPARWRAPHARQRSPVAPRSGVRSTRSERTHRRAQPPLSRAARTSVRR